AQGSQQKGRNPALFSLQSADFLIGQEEPGIQYRVRVERNAFDALLHQPLGQVRMIRRPLSTYANVLVSFFAGFDGAGQQLLDRRITLVEQVGNDARVTVQTKGQLS